MQIEGIPVAERINLIKSIFSEFGIIVADNSMLHQVICAEFGRGKRSVLNQILIELQQDTEAAVLSTKIGQAISKNTNDAEVLLVANIMQQKLPSVLQIVDIRKQTSKRLALLEQLFLHFEIKLNSAQNNDLNPPIADRLLRMLAGARGQLKNILETQAMAEIVERGGVIGDKQDMQRAGKILRELVPALIFVDRSEIMLEQKIDSCLHVMHVIAKELGHSKLNKVVGIIDVVHSLAKLTLPEISDHAYVDAALQQLGISLGNVSLALLQNKAKNLGVNEEEFKKILYLGCQAVNMSSQDKDLLDITCRNRQHAAACGFLAKLGQDLGYKDLEHVGLAGLCLISMRQTYSEFKTNNLNSVNLSESVGLFVSSIGIMTGNKLVAQIGASIIEGVKAYAGIMAIPGGQYVAVPLAICTAVSKVLLANKSTGMLSHEQRLELVLNSVLKQIISLQIDMRQHFAHLYDVIQQQHKHVFVALDQGFMCLKQYSCFIQIQHYKSFNLTNNRLDLMLCNIGIEFNKLYLEYIKDPIDEIDFYVTYHYGDMQQMQSNKMKLSMWLLFKAKNDKINGGALLSHCASRQEMSVYIAMLLHKVREGDAVLGMVNRYLNLEFNQQFPEDIPHLPTWLLAAEKYITLLNEHNEFINAIDKEEKILHDIIAVAEQILNFFDCLAANDQFWSESHAAKNDLLISAQREIAKILVNNNDENYVSSLISRQAEAAPVNEQLEAFDQISLDLSHVWERLFVPHIRDEIFQAEKQGLGTINIKFAIDPSTTRCFNVRARYTDNFLPDDARDVIYKIDVSFYLHSKLAHYHLFTAWFTYDLCNSFKRFHEYYNLKFQYGLPHADYLWISIDGLRNQVNGYEETDTHKLISRKQVAEIYRRWWRQTCVITDPCVAKRLKKNPVFYSKHAKLLDQNQYVNVDVMNNELLIMQLQIEIKEKLLRQQLETISTLQSSKIIVQNLEKYDAYNASLGVLKEILNHENIRTSLLIKFNQILDGLDINNYQEVNPSFRSDLLALCVGSFEKKPEFTNYKTGIFYQNVEQTSIRLQMLINSLAPAIRISN